VTVVSFLIPLPLLVVLCVIVHPLLTLPLLLPCITITITITIKSTDFLLVFWYGTYSIQDYSELCDHDYEQIFLFGLSIIKCATFFYSTCLPPCQVRLGRRGAIIDAASPCWPTITQTPHKKIGKKRA
jgi:hypothetical protein